MLVRQLETLVAAVERERASARPGYGSGHPAGTPATSNVKVVQALFELMFRLIPQDPQDPRYRIGKTLGAGRQHWRRAKFGAGRFRLFFRYRTDARVIVYVWVNDQDTLRTYGSRTDAYAVFKRMLDGGRPPDGFEALLAAAEADPNPDDAQRIVRGRTSGETPTDPRSRA